MTTEQMPGYAEMRDTVRQMLADWKASTPEARAVTLAIAAGMSKAREVGIETFDERTAFAMRWARSHRIVFAEKEGADLADYDCALQAAYGY